MCKAVGVKYNTSVMQIIKVEKPQPFACQIVEVFIVTLPIQFPNHFLEDLKKLVGEDHL